MFSRLGPLLCLLLVLAGCSRGDGRTLQPPPPGATIAERVPASTTTAAAPATTPQLAVPMQLLSPSFASGSQLPTEFTCDGAQRPPLTWTDLPDGTAELALVVRRVDDQSVIWTVTGIDPATPGLGSGPVAPPAVEHPHTGDEAGWVAPCSEDGTVRTYEWILYALASSSGLAADSTASEAAGAADIRSIDRAVLTAFTP